MSYLVALGPLQEVIKPRDAVAPGLRWLVFISWFLLAYFTRSYHYSFTLLCSMCIVSPCASYILGHCLTSRQAQISAAAYFQFARLCAVCSVDIVARVAFFWPSTYLLFHFWHLAFWICFPCEVVSCSLLALNALTRRTLLAQVCLQAKFFCFF